jgi:two-component system, NarL family, sensor histidine kinase DesK
VNRERVTPATMALMWRLAGIILLGALWVVEAGGEAGLILVLFLCILALARWRVAVPSWAVVVDQAACIGALAFWPASAFGLALPLFDACVAARPIWALPSLVVISLFGLWSLPLAAVASVAVLSGWAIHLWASQLQRARQEADRDRRERFELESLKNELLSANVRVARLAKLAERNRIARDLHDHAGHEMTAAQLALQAFHRLWEEGDPQAAGMLAQAEGRVAAGMELLRSTVRGMAPQGAAGIGALEEV